MTRTSTEELTPSSRSRFASTSPKQNSVPLHSLPRHIGVIMDGNRRYGRAHLSSANAGHKAGGEKIIDFTRWCREEGIRQLTVYAFSTENWNRPKKEVDLLMLMFVKYCGEIQREAMKDNMKINVLTTEHDNLPENVVEGVKNMTSATAGNSGFIVNICLSYGSRSEIVNAARKISDMRLRGEVEREDITEELFGDCLLTGGGEIGDPEVIIRTSGENRLSNFLLYQSAYSEFFFLEKDWPAIERNDLVGVIEAFAKRNRRFGK